MITEDLIQEALKLPRRGRVALEKHFNLTQSQARKLAIICQEREKRKDPGEDNNHFDNDTTTVTNQYSNDKALVMSAWGNDGRMMDIDEYCKHYNLPRKDIRSYKLVSHTGTPYYNIAFHEVAEELSFLTPEFISSITKKHIKPIDFDAPTSSNIDAINITRGIFTDTHLAMDTDIEGTALYPTPWNKETQEQKIRRFANKIIQKSRKGDTLIIDDLGDFMDGLDGKTVRREHELPQNMHNDEAYDHGVYLKVLLCDILVSCGLFVSIRFNNICNDNHAGSFGYFVNSHVKDILEIKYKGLVTVHNYRKFINHYFIGDHCFIISHGKDKKNLKFGFKPKLDDAGEKKISNYIRENKIKSPFIEFSKGDSHQMLFDMATSDLFNYMNYMAFSPASEWVQTGFQRGRSGFVIQRFNMYEKIEDYSPIEF